MPSLIASLAAVTVVLFAFRGADSISIIFIAAIAWAVAFALIGALFYRRPADARSYCVWGAIAAALVLTASVVVTRWPVRLGLAIYSSQFQELADRVAAGHPFQTPQRVGPITLQSGAVERGFVCLWTDLDPSGRTGYVRGAAGVSVPFNIWSLDTIGSGWYFLVED